MQLVELGTVEPQFGRESGLQHEGLVLLPRQSLYAQALQRSQLAAFDVGHKEFAVGLHHSIEHRAPCHAVGLHDERLHVVVAVVHHISLKGGGGNLLHIGRQETQVQVELVTSLALLRLGLEGDGLVGRFPFGFLVGCLLLGLPGSLVGSRACARIHLAYIVVAVIHQHHFFPEHGDFESVLILDQHNVLALESAHATASHFGEEAHLVTYLHILFVLSYFSKHKFRGFLRNKDAFSPRIAVTLHPKKRI